MKSLLANTILIPVWNYPTYFLLIAIALVFIADLYNQYIASRKIICTTTDFLDFGQTTKEKKDSIQLVFSRWY